MKKIILAAALVAPLALGSAAFAQDAGGFAGAPVNDIVTTPQTGAREFTARNRAVRQVVPVTRAEQVEIDIQQVPSTTGGNS
ncbi:hypothetical protein E8L99_13495 [Phreatobacter aquaticus]|uniref:Uncharacterized protein n=1 Tax=Phreatobacter aquaticus TaxID=2570229 RepID=A0A4D7QJ78_9HYPH|nr:hypothetical protein [Phreatobacter aquaticus]QCK86701.1 hypothetical protein E8L99_13495 [Phreatobacter aquaticus]